MVVLLVDVKDISLFLVHGEDNIVDKYIGVENNE